MAKRRKEKAGVGVHGHACTCCGARYEDACSKRVIGKKLGVSIQPGDDALCEPCKTGRPQPWWPEARLPKDCCRKHSRPVRTWASGKKAVTEYEKYALAGSKTWFICDDKQGGCSRTHPFDPSREREEHHGSSECRAHTGGAPAAVA